MTAKRLRREASQHYRRSTVTNRPELTIVVPAYNEQDTVTEILRRVTQTELSQTGNVEIVVVDDGSTDDTWGRLLQWANTRHIKLIRHEMNRGKGAAIRSALDLVTGRYVAIQDADLEYDPRDLEMMLLRVVSEQSDVIYGSRYLSEQHSDWGLKRSRWMSYGVHILNWLASVLYGVQTSDLCTCYKMVRTSLLQSMRLEADGFEFCAEVTAKLGRMNCRITEVPISYVPRTVTEGKKIRWKDGIALLNALWRHRNWHMPEDVMFAGSDETTLSRPATSASSHNSSPATDPELQRLA